MKNNILPLFLVVIVFFLPALSHGAEINLSVAASMTDAFKTIMKEFSLGRPDIRLRPNFASSGSLAKQVAQGAPADIYVSANPEWMKYLVAKKLIKPGAVRILAYNTMVFVSTGQKSGLDMSGLAKLDRIAIGTPLSVPAGRYAQQAMENSGVYAPLKKANKLVMAKDVRQALWYADQGEVDGAFVYKTDALLATRAKIVFSVPGDLHDLVSYPLALTVDGGKKKSARAFYKFMSSPRAIAILERYGFEPVR